LGETLPENALIMLDGIIDGQFYISVINKIELPGSTEPLSNLESLVSDKTIERKKDSSLHPDPESFRDRDEVRNLLKLLG